jgi:YidC/Oxa1 family membrane protein insertase
MDRNSITGIIIIVGMLLGYEYFFGSKIPAPETKKAIAVKGITKKENKKDSISLNNSVKDSIAIEAKDFVIENNDIKVTLSNIGGKIKQVQLKNYYSYANYTNHKKDGLILFDSKKDKFSIQFPIGSQKINISNLPSNVENVSSKGITFVSKTSSGKSIKQVYLLNDTGFELKYSLDTKEIASEITGNEYTIDWEENIHQTEKDINEERKATINYLLQEDEEFDNLTENPSNKETETLSKNVDWITFKKKYFIAGLIPQNFNFSKAELNATPNLNDSLNIKTLQAKIAGNVSDLQKSNGQFKFYFGPNDYSKIKNIAPSFGKNVKLSYDFLLPITKYIYVPLFDFLESIISNYGLLIIVLVLIIKSALLPLTYKSYVSMAKTRILAPEIAKIKERIGDDAAKVQQETMKLYQEVGVNPLSGCIPVLATMPILMAVFLLFPNLINLRQQSFLWANDLSTFDSIITLPFNIPFYGSHVSLFCLLMTISQLAYGYYNNQITPDQPGQPIDMKKMAYITPVIFMFVMNSFAAGLSFYYFVSNLVTIGQQLAIRKFVNEDKIKVLLDENRKKIASGGGKKSKFSQYLQNQMKAVEEAQKAQQSAKAKSKK